MYNLLQIGLPRQRLALNERNVSFLFPSTCCSSVLPMRGNNNAEVSYGRFPSRRDITQPKVLRDRPRSAEPGKNLRASRSLNCPAWEGVAWCAATCRIKCRIYLRHKTIKSRSSLALVRRAVLYETRLVVEGLVKDDEVMCFAEML